MARIMCRERPEISILPGGDIQYPGAQTMHAIGIRHCR